MGTPAPGCNGTVFNILKPGSGPEVKKGATVTVHATGVVKESGKKFWCVRSSFRPVRMFKSESRHNRR